MPHESNSPEPNRNIQIWPLIAISLKRCWAARDHLLLIGIVPVTLDLLILTPLVGMLPIFMANPQDEAAVAAAMPMALLLVLCHFAVMSLFSVNLLRVLALGPGSVPLLGLTIGGRHLRYYLFRIGVGLLTIFAMIILVVVLQKLGRLGIAAAVGLAALLGLTLIARLTPCWIGIAIDAPMRLSVAWRRTRGQGFKLVLVLIVFAAAAFVAEQLFGAIFYATGLIGVAPLAFDFLICAMEMIRVALQLGALLAAYPQFVRETV